MSKVTINIDKYNICAHIGKSTVYFTTIDSDRKCPIYMDTKSRFPKVQYRDTTGKVRYKSLRVLFQEIEDVSEFPDIFSIPVRHRKSRRHIGDRPNHTEYKTISKNQLVDNTQ